MVQFIGSQRVGQDLATEQQQNPFEYSGVSKHSHFQKTLFFFFLNPSFYEKNVNISRKLKKKRIVNSRSIATTWQWEAGEQLVLSQD